MERIDAEWLRQAFARTGKTQLGLARKLGINPSQVNRMVDKDKPRRIKADEVEAIIEYFKEVSDSSNSGTEKSQPLEYATLTNLFNLPRDVPVYGIGLGGNEGTVSLNGQVIERVSRPPRLQSVTGAYAIYVHGDSMKPWRKSGDLVYVHPNQPCNPGDYVVVQLKPQHEGDSPEALVKELVRRTAQDIKLRQFNPEKEFTVPWNRVYLLHRVMDWTELLGR